MGVSRLWRRCAETKKDYVINKEKQKAFVFDKVRLTLFFLCGNIGMNKRTSVRKKRIQLPIVAGYRHRCGKLRLVQFGTVRPGGNYALMRATVNQIMYGSFVFPVFGENRWLVQGRSDVQTT